MNSVGKFHCALKWRHDVTFDVSSSTSDEEQDRLRLREADTSSASRAGYNLNKVSLTQKPNRFHEYEDSLYRKKMSKRIEARENRGPLSADFDELSGQLLQNLNPEKQGIKYT